MIEIKTGVCGSILEDSKENVLKTLKSVCEDDVEYLEVRLDKIADISPELAVDIIESVKEISDKKLIVTNRIQSEGGYFAKTEEERIEILIACAPLVEYTDIEYKTRREDLERVVEASHKSIISYHNFDTTPEEKVLQDIIDHAGSMGTLTKIAVMPESITDTYTIIRLLTKNDNLIAISMGETGKYTRVIAPIMGSPITYASIATDTAPGQLDVKTTSQMIKKLRSG